MYWISYRQHADQISQNLPAPHKTFDRCAIAGHVTMMWNGWTWVQSSAEVKVCFPSPKLQIGCRPTQPLIQPVRAGEDSPPSTVEVKNAWRCTSTPTICFHGVGSVDFSFTYYEIFTWRDMCTRNIFYTKNCKLQRAIRKFRLQNCTYIKKYKFSGYHAVGIDQFWVFFAIIVWKLTNPNSIPYQNVLQL